MSREKREDMLKIGIVGIGAISQKAYLPYMRQLLGVEWHLFTRQADVRQAVWERFGSAKAHESLEDMLKVDLDGVFIHAATKVHFDLASQFLERGIPVYMDKPLTEDFQTSRKLYDIAKTNRTFLMAGFNRRFAPRVLEMRQLSDKKRLLVEKDDINRPGEITFKLFDFFIHPLDIAIYLLDEPLLAAQFNLKKEENLLSHISVVLDTEHTSAHVSMNLQSGSRREVMEIQSPSGTYHLEDLDKLTIYNGTDSHVKAFGSWDTTLYKRGFESIIDAFLEAVKIGINPVSAESSLLSHWLCHQINQSGKNRGELDVNLPK